MRMEKTHYLPSEELKKNNYPEVVKVQADIDLIISYAMVVDLAVMEYNEGLKDKIDVSIVELQKTIDRCRAVCEVLGKSSNVCFDVLLEIRTLQANFQDILFIRRRFGSEYVGNPSEVDDFGDGGIG